MNGSSPLRVPESPALSPSQLAKVADLGTERTADAGDVLFQVGDDRYPFITILEGEVAILDGAGNEVVRQGPSNFLGELSLLSGQSAFLTAVVKEPLRYIEVDRDALRACCSTTSRSASCCSRRSSRDGRRCSRSRGLDLRSSARIRPWRRGGCSTLLATTGSP